MKLEASSITASVRDRRIVDNVSIEVRGGELVGLIGPNGAGKSTLLKCVLGIRARENGKVMIGGDDLSALPMRERAKRIAFLPQDRHVEWRLPAYDVVMLGRYPHHSGFGGYSAADRAAVDRAIEAVDGEAFTRRPVSVLSGGERNRVLLARALAVEAPILLVDEPIAALDPYHQLHVMEILRGIARRGGGVLAVIHDLSLASRFMDRLVVMDQGVVVANGTPSDVLTPALLGAVYGVEAVAASYRAEPYILPWARKSQASPPHGSTS